MGIADERPAARYRKAKLCRHRRDRHRFHAAQLERSAGACGLFRERGLGEGQPPPVVDRCFRRWGWIGNGRQDLRRTVDMVRKTFAPPVVDAEIAGDAEQVAGRVVGGGAAGRRRDEDAYERILREVGGRFFGYAPAAEGLRNVARMLPEEMLQSPTGAVVFAGRRSSGSLGDRKGSNARKPIY